MNNNDDKLHELLSNWRGIEPRPDFEADVYRRIRQSQHEPSPSFVGWLREWLQPAPALAAIAALLVAAAIGFRAPERPTAAGTLNHGTISGNYAELVMGGAK